MKIAEFFDRHFGEILGGMAFLLAVSLWLSA
jgi:hypothetical protein